MAAAEITNADAIHPGYGFLSENEMFADICQKYGIKFIGPRADHVFAPWAIRSQPKNLCAKAGVPVVRVAMGCKDVADAREQAKKDPGYPVMLKTTAGGGGKECGSFWGEKIWKMHMPVQTPGKSWAQQRWPLYGRALKEQGGLEIRLPYSDQYGKPATLVNVTVLFSTRHQKLVKKAPPFVDEKLREKDGRNCCQSGRKHWL